MITESLHRAGPLLAQLLDSQRREAHLVGYPAIEEVADAAITAVQRIGSCLIWPVGAAAERVAGVIAVRSHGTVDVATWNSAVAGRRILLLGGSAVTPLGLQTTAEQLRRRGAAEVHACAVDVPGAKDARGFDSFQSLRVTASRPSMSIADASADSASSTPSKVQRSMR